MVAAGPLTEGYATEIRPAHGELWRRTPRFAAVRLIHLALECAEFAAEASRGRTQRLLRAATDLISGCSDLEHALVDGAGR
jgi:hypothetical protein